MIKDNQKSLNHVQVLLDAVVTAVAYILAWFIIVSGKVVPLRGATLEPGPYFLALIFIVPVYLILNGCFHLYVPKRIQGRRVEFANICKANVIGLMLFTLILFGGRSFIVHLGYFSTRMLLVFFCFKYTSSGRRTTGDPPVLTFSSYQWLQPEACALNRLQPCGRRFY